MDLPEESIYMDPALYKAAAQGKIDPFDNYQTSINQLLTPNKNTILHIYLQNQSTKRELAIINPLLLLKEILKKPESSDFMERILEMCPPLLLQANIKGEILLHFAARYGIVNVATVLIDRAKALPLDVESGLTEAKKMLRMTNAKKDTALHVAAQNLRSSVVEILTKEDPDFSYSANHYGETPLYLVTNMKSLVIGGRKARTKVIHTILRNCKLVDYSGPNGRTALHAAVMNNDPDTVEILLRKQESLTKKTDENGWSPLHYAAYINSTSITKLLLKYKVSSAYIVDTDMSRTALHIAAIRGNVEVVEEIVSSCPACCELVDNRGWNILHYAAAITKARRLFETAKNSSRLGQLIYEKDDGGDTPLHLLAAFGTINWFVLPYEFIFSAKRKCGVNMQGLSVDDILGGYFPEKKKEVLVSIEDVGSGPFGRTVAEERKARSEDYRTLRLDKVRPERLDQWNKEKEERLDKARDAHIVVATLIATVTFAAAFTLPGGYKNEQGPNQGTAILTNKAAFNVFVISDAIAMVLSISAVFAHFWSALLQKDDEQNNVIYFFQLAAGLIVAAMGTMVIAFITGTYAVLATSLGLAITTCFIGLSFFLFFLYTPQFYLNSFLAFGLRVLSK